MVFELVIPDLTKKGTCKDFIVDILTKNWPLTLKEIYNKVKKEHKYPGSYQSVFKSVNELIDKKVICRTGNKYELNISWVKKLQSFTDIVETNYYVENTGEKSRSKKEKIVVLNFNSLFDAEKYLYYFVKNELKKMKNEKIIYELSHLWKVLFYFRAEYNLYKKLIKLGHEFYFSYFGNSQIEDRAREFYKKIGIKIKKRKTGDFIDSIIFNDYYIQIFIPEKLKAKIRKYLDEEREYDLLKVLDEEYLVKVIIHKEKDLSESQKQSILKKF